MPFWPFRRKPRKIDAETVGDLTPRRRQFGREYTAGIPYGLPSDVEEMSRLDFQHFVLRQAFRGNYAAPIQSPSSILDVGCGTGRWGKEMAVLFPNANVVGLDINDPGPDEPSQGAGLSPRAENYAFVAGNILEGLPFPDASFDFVHQRLLFFAIPGDRWQFVVSELARVTRPGGWVELVEGRYGYDPMGPVAERLSNVMLPAVQRSGVDPRHSAHLDQFLRAAGLQRVEQHTAKLPVGDWGGRLGKLVALDVHTFFQAAKPLLLAQGLSEGQVAEVNEAMRLECEQLHTTWPFYIVDGQRPA